MEMIKCALEILAERGYKNYGTTVRPITNVQEVETKNGHKYYSRENAPVK